MTDLFTHSSAAMPEISVVVPVFNEAGNLEPLFGALKSKLDSVTKKWECVFVDDGSRDGSLEELRKLNATDARVRFLALSRNFGHQIALTAGIDSALGDAVISLDADLQHPPDIIPDMIKRWREGNDVVYGVRRSTEDAGWFKRTSASAFYWVMSRLSQTSIHAGSADFRLLSRRAADSIRSIREHDRFIRGLVSWIGFNQVAVFYVAPPRQHGESKYSLTRMVRLALDGVTSFSSAPLHIAVFLGLAVSALSAFYMLVVLYWRLFTNKTVPGWTSLTIIMLFLGGVQLLCIGILGEYIGRIYSEIKRRPLYIVKETGGTQSSSLGAKL